MYTPPLCNLLVTKNEEKKKKKEKEKEKPVSCWQE
jgi:hypothetical protein